MRDMGAQWVCEPSHELPQSNSAERITKQHENWVEGVDAHALVPSLRLNREYLLRQGFQ